ncbi:MAG: hypothetical protein H6828_05075 [Planctomycetes bacterium]|nr:hypothetical protein [Planctomycetota bacterium]
MRLEPAQAAELLAAGVMDSKKLTDARALRLGAWLRADALRPARARTARLQRRLGQPRPAHRALQAARRVHPRRRRARRPRRRRPVLGEGRDRPAPRGPRRRARAPPARRGGARRRRRVDPRARQVPRAAEGARRRGRPRLPKGAGPPVDAAGATLLRDQGDDALARVAKLHSRTPTRCRPVVSAPLITQRYAGAENRFLLVEDAPPGVDWPAFARAACRERSFDGARPTACSC